MPAAAANLIANDLINIIALAFLLALLHHNPVLFSGNETAFRACIVLTTVILLAEMACAALEQGDACVRTAHIAANVVGFSASGALPYLFTAAHDARLARHRRFLLIPPALLTVLCILSAWTGWIFSVTSENVYLRGPLFFVYTAIFLAGILLLLAASFQQSFRFFRWEKVFLLLLYLLFVAGVSMQVLFPALHTSWNCVTLALLLYCAFERELQFKYDLLTNVLNRTAFVQEVGRSPRAGSVIIVLDIDSFKAVNDRYGHQAGDRCLQSAAAVIQRSFSDIGRCFRIGGDEFAVLGRASEAVLLAAAGDMIARIQALREKDPILPNISYGYSILKKGESFQSAFRRADEQMYRFKTGRSDDPSAGSADDGDFPDGAFSPADDNV